MILKTYNVTKATADKLRAAAPRLGLTPSPVREIVGPGIEAIHLPDAVAQSFELRRKAAKVSADVMASRIAGKVA